MLKLLLLQILTVSNANLAATRFEAVTQSSSSMGQMATSSRVQGTFTGSRFRMDFLETSTPRSIMPAGSYMIFAENHAYIIDSIQKGYYELDFAKMQASASAMLKQMPGLQMKFSRFNFDVEDLGDGETILGHPTRHWRVVGSMTMTGLMGQDTMGITIETSADHFFAADMSLPVSPPMSSDSSAIIQYGDMIPAADAAKVRSAMARLPKSLDLKSESKVSSSFGPMDMTVTSTSRVTKIEAVSVDASFFEVPAGYKKVEMPMPAPPQRNF